MLTLVNEIAQETNVRPPIVEHILLSQYSFLRAVIGTGKSEVVHLAGLGKFYISQKAQDDKIRRDLRRLEKSNLEDPGNGNGGPE